jgi:pyrroloquinoline quinone biosynthesis protein D
MSPAAATVPRLARGCRIAEDPAHGPVLLIPEGVLRLIGPGLSIVRKCDGARTFADIVRELGVEFPGADPQTVERDAAAFLARLCERRAIDFE